MFRPGELVVCIKRGKWVTIPTGEVQPPGPQYGDTLRVTEAITNAHVRDCIQVSGWPARWFIADRFRPLNDSHFDNELIERIKGNVHA